MRVIKTPADEFPINPANVDNVAGSRISLNRVNLVTEYPQMATEQAGIVPFF